jgi:hypothetical protein
MKSKKGFQRSKVESTSGGTGSQGLAALLDISDKKAEEA